VTADSNVGFGELIGWNHIAAWLVDNGILAPAADHPLVPVPGTGGAGIDGARIAVVVVAIIVWLLLLSDIRGRKRRIPPHQY